ncbi:MAG: hypothetical protein WCL50_08975, partial [Spirochaetota bacterium]
MSSTALEVLALNLSNLKSSLRWLKRSFERCSQVGPKPLHSDEEFDDFENLTSRYARTIDLIVGKVLRSIDAVEFLDRTSTPISRNSFRQHDNPM